MPSRAEVEAFAQSNRDIRALVLAALQQFWAGLDTSDAMAVRAALEEFLPLLVAQYGEVAAGVAADFYDSLRDASGAAGSFRAVLADPLDAEIVRGRARWSIGPLFDADPKPANALGRLVQVTDELTLQTGRNTIARSVAKDPAKASWARVPVGKTCAFCLMLASRGATYRSEETAGKAHKYHGHCDCTPTPFWRNDPYPEGYDPDALYQAYLDARAAAKSDRGSESTKAILAQIRENEGLAH